MQTRFSNFYVYVVDPLVDAGTSPYKMTLKRQTRLHYGELGQIHVSSSAVLNKDCLMKGAFYTNGHYLMVMVPPPFAAGKY
jgi:hypothetical protein